jgi:mycothiol system anti-sigma-R factor
VSCGKPHETPCEHVLEAVYQYIDAECDVEQARRIKQHLTECDDCLQEYGIEQEVKILIGRCCGAPAPEGLADRLREKLATLKLAS